MKKYEYFINNGNIDNILIYKLHETRDIEFEVKYMKEEDEKIYERFEYNCNKFKFRVVGGELQFICRDMDTTIIDSVIYEEYIISESISDGEHHGYSIYVGEAVSKRIMFSDLPMGIREVIVNYEMVRRIK